MPLVPLLIALAVVTPSFAHAQSSFQNFFTNLLTFINSTLIPFILGIAFLFFIINIVRYFVFAGGSEDGRTKAKNQALYSVLAFFIIVVFWGTVNLLSSSIGLNAGRTPLSDYVKLNGGTLAPASNSKPPSSSSKPATSKASSSAQTGGGGTSGGNTPPPTNILPPAFGGPAENGRTCPEGATFNGARNTCEFQ